MTRKQISLICQQKASELEMLGFDYWQSKINDLPFVESLDYANEKINIELCLLESTSNFIHIAVIGDDGSFLMSLWPVSSASFILRKL